jgi:hypothetical protein
VSDEKMEQAKADAVVFRLNTQDEIRVTLGEIIYLHYDHQGKRTVDNLTDTPLGRLLLREFAGLL